MALPKSVKAEVLRGPFDPGGQPDVRSGQPLELSLFAWNIRSGLSGTKAVLSDPERYRDYWDWSISSKLLTEAERIGLEGQFQFGMWAGWGGDSGWATASLDFASAAAAGAAITERLRHVSTVHVGYRFHPLHIAKIGACTDHISNGRWGLNIVPGQNKADYAMFGFEAAPPSEVRYAIADEFVTLTKHLWASDEPIDFEGEYFQAYGAVIEPKPTSRPRPLLINAGASSTGMDFACRHTDMVFVSPWGGLEDYPPLVQDVHSRAAKYGRRVQVAAMSYLVMEDTDAEAERVVDWLKSELDKSAIENFIHGATGTSADVSPDDDDPWLGVPQEQWESFGLGLTGYQLFGSYETVAERIRALHETGVEHVCLGFLEPKRGLQQMEEHVLPILRKMNLRK